jgi:hypothetical protein
MGQVQLERHEPADLMNEPVANDDTINRLKSRCVQKKKESRRLHQYPLRNRGCVYGGGDFLGGAKEAVNVNASAVPNASLRF